MSSTVHVHIHIHAQNGHSHRLAEPASKKPPRIAQIRPRAADFRDHGSPSSLLTGQFVEFFFLRVNRNAMGCGQGCCSITRKIAGPFVHNQMATIGQIEPVDSGSLYFRKSGSGGGMCGGHAADAGGGKLHAHRRNLQQHPPVSCVRLFIWILSRSPSLLSFPPKTVAKSLGKWNRITEWASRRTPSTGMENKHFLVTHPCWEYIVIVHSSCRNRIIRWSFPQRRPRRT